LESQDDLHDFYSIAAQVIPALLVAMLFAQSLPKLHPHVQVGGLALVTFVAVVGEGFALRRVLGQGDEYPDLFFTIAGIAASGAGVLWVAVTGRPPWPAPTSGARPWRPVCAGASRRTSSGTPTPSRWLARACR
jgi:hypothetical protein